MTWVEAQRIKIINDELRVRMKKNPFGYKSIHEMLKRYRVKSFDESERELSLIREVTWR